MFNGLLVIEVEGIEVGGCVIVMDRMMGLRGLEMLRVLTCLVL